MRTFVVTAAMLLASCWPARADSCSSRTDLCNNACYHRVGDAAQRCFLYCKNEKRACLHTGLFRTTGGNYSGLDRK